ncbi:MAG TPA: DUF4810 domain-containing protein, partial [Dehalococcoidia bacterium]|nr:DUF4810 domain-containing protein [Dehalococcoidia bacterium]
SYAPILYNYTKLPSDETLAAHRESLEDIIAKSNEKNLRVPPGVYAELGYIEQKRGDQDASTAYYESEMKLYPEATPFLERLVSGMKKEDGESL